MKSERKKTKRKIDELYFEMINCGEEKDYYYRVIQFENDKRIFEFKDEMGDDFIRESRIRYLRGVISPLRTKLERLLALKKKHGEFFILGKELKEIKNKYKRLYMEYGIVNTDKQTEGQYSKNEIELARNVPVEKLIAGQVFNVGKGRKRMLCPFHKEKDGSFFIFPENTWHCFGCMAHGSNAVDFIMKKNNLNFPDAIAYLKRF